MGQLLLGAPRRGRRRSVPGNPPGQTFGGEIYLSFPGLGDRLAARVAGEIGDHIEQFDSPNALGCYAGKAPVTRRSEKGEYVVACRLACNRHLRDAVQQWAFCSLSRSGWAREFYDRHIADHHSHHAALRALGNRLARGALTLPDPPSGVTTRSTSANTANRNPGGRRPAGRA